MATETAQVRVSVEGVPEFVALIAAAMRLHDAIYYAPNAVELVQGMSDPIALAYADLRQATKVWRDR